MLELILLAIVVYSVLTRRVYTTDGSEGHHKYCTTYYYTNPETKEEEKLNDNWYAKGREVHYGFFGYGYVKFINSFRRPSIFKYFSVMIPILGNKEIGLDIGVVRGYKNFKKGTYIGRWLIGVCPKMRWRDARVHRKSIYPRFVSMRQFGSASINTSGSVK